MEKDINEIKVKDNIRKDVGDLTELMDSIREKGILSPILINSKGEIIFGHRRFEAAKKLGLLKIPVEIRDLKDDEIVEAQLVENIQRKDLNIVEEAQALQDYLTKSKKNIEFLSKRLGKSKIYVEKRLKINGLPKEIKEKLIEGKLVFGHALLLARLPEVEATKYMKDIISQDKNVGTARRDLEYSSLSQRLSEACFNKEACKDCKWNGGVQSELFETGKVLNGKCLNPSCFKKKIEEHIKQVKKGFEKVLIKSEDEYSVRTPNGFVDSGYTWSLKENGIDKKYMDKCREEKNPETYLVFVNREGKVTEYFKKPKKSGEKATESKADDNKKGSETWLKARIDSWKNDFLIETSEKLATYNDTFRRVIFWHLAEEYGDGLSLKGRKELFNEKMSSEELSEKIKELGKNIFGTMPEDILEIASKQAGVVYAEHFKMSEEFLQPFTKEQLVSLAKELKMDLAGCVKNGEIKKRIITLWKKGQVPKILS